MTTTRYLFASILVLSACDGSAAGVDPAVDAGRTLPGRDGGPGMEDSSVPSSDPDGAASDPDAGSAGVDAGPGVPPGPWTAPIGIPEPEFGIHEGVDNTCGELSEVAFPGFDRLDDLAAGSVVTIPAGTHAPEDVVLIGGTGTPCQPIIVRGDPAERPVLRGTVGISGSYVILEHVEIDLSANSEDRVGIGASDHVAARHIEVHGLDVRRNTTVVYLEGSTDVVIWDAHIHDNGDFSVSGEIDVHGIGAGRSHRVWIVDSHIHHNRGDGMQFGHQADNTLGQFYVGRNDIHDNGENSVDIKEASQVVISENRLHGEPLGDVVLHDCPIDAAVIYNEIYDATYGVSLPSLESNCDDDLPVSLFVLRNEIHDIDGSGVQGWGSGKRYFIAGNTFASVGDDVDVDPIPSGSAVSADDAALEPGFAAFEATYGLDIRP